MQIYLLAVIYMLSYMDLRSEFGLALFCRSGCGVETEGVTSVQLSQVFRLKQKKKKKGTNISSYTHLH